MKTTLHIHTFENCAFGNVVRGSAMARNPLAGIVRAARSVGLVAKRQKSGTWQFTRPAFGFNPPSSYQLR